MVSVGPPVASTDAPERARIVQLQLLVALAEPERTDFDSAIVAGQLLQIRKTDRRRLETHNSVECVLRLRDFGNRLADMGPDV
jgi:hypothetical protein